MQKGCHARRVTPLMLNHAPQTRRPRVKKHPGDLMRIAFLGVRVPGHLNPMTTLARKLKARGHDVVFIADLDSESAVRAAQLPFISDCETELPLGAVRQTSDQ